MKGKLVLMREETELRDDASITTVRLPQQQDVSVFQWRPVVKDLVPVPLTPHYCTAQQIREKDVFGRNVLRFHIIRPSCRGAAPELAVRETSTWRVGFHVQGGSAGWCDEPRGHASSHGRA